MKKKVYIYLFDGYSDWEIAYLTPEIRKNTDFEIVYFSENGKDVVSMGGLQVKIAESLNDVSIDHMTMLILPGGTMWEGKNKGEIEVLVRDAYSKGIPVAAICGAVNCLAELGILNSVKHTGNDLNYLKAVAPSYTGDAYYEHELAFEDKGIITASGIAPIEFAREVFKITGLKSDEEIENWYQLFKYGIWKG